MSRVKACLINWNKSKPKRAGVILFDGKYYYVGKDHKTKDITDFGGKVNFYENAIEGAIREMEEETHSSFPKIKWLDLYNSEVLVDDNIVIFILKVDYDVQKYISLFNDKRDRSQYNEIIEIVALEPEDIKNVKVYNLIERCIKLLV